MLTTLTLDVLKSSEIEGEMLNKLLDGCVQQARAMKTLLNGAGSSHRNLLIMGIAQKKKGLGWLSERTFGINHPWLGKQRLNTAALFSGQV